MSAAKHTPGPWELFDTPQGIGVTATEADVAHCDGFHVGGRTRDEELANARLIAAAPDLLQALIEAREELAAYEQDLNGEGYNNPKLNAAIAKAEGRCDD